MNDRIKEIVDDCASPRREGNICAVCHSPWLLLLLSCLLFCSGCLSPSVTLTHPDFNARICGLTNLVVLPVPATAIKINVIRGEEVPFPKVEEFCQEVRAQVARQFEQLGLRVSQSRLEMGSWRTVTNRFEDRDVWMQLQLQRAYQSLARVGGYARGDVVNPEAGLLAGYEGADGLIFVGASTVMESPQAKGTRWTANTLAIFLGLGLAVASNSTPSIDFAGSPERSTLEVILVDGRTGEILWRSMVTCRSLEGANLDAAVRRVFDRYP